MNTKKDNKLAKLALYSSTDKDRPSTPCPSSEELSAFIEEKSQDKDILAHLSHCSACYEEWREVSLLHFGSHKRESFYKKKRIFAATGSGFAIAASIMLFLYLPANIKDQPQKVIYNESVMEEEDSANTYMAPAPQIDLAPKKETIMMKSRMAQSPPVLATRDFRQDSLYHGFTTHLQTTCEEQGTIDRTEVLKTKDQLVKRYKDAGQELTAKQQQLFKVLQDTSEQDICEEIRKVLDK